MGEHYRRDFSYLYALLLKRAVQKWRQFLPSTRRISYLSLAKLDRNRSSASEAKKHFNQRSKVRARAPNLTILWISCNRGDTWTDHVRFTKSREGWGVQTLLLRENVSRVNRINRGERCVEAFLFGKENLPSRIAPCSN